MFLFLCQLFSMRAYICSDETSLFYSSRIIKSDFLTKQPNWFRVRVCLSVITGNSNRYRYSEYADRGQTEKRKTLTGPRRKEAISCVFPAAATQHVRNQITSHIQLNENLGTQTSPKYSLLER